MTQDMFTSGIYLMRVNRPILLSVNIVCKIMVHFRVPLSIFVFLVFSLQMAFLKKKLEDI